MDMYHTMTSVIHKRRLYRAHQWIYTLSYPAVLGSLTVSLLVAVAGGIDLFGFHFLFSLFIAVYFATQHVQNTIDLKHYSWASFWADCAEIAVVFVLFYQLGFFREAFMQDPNTFEPNKGVYYLFAFGFLLPVFARVITSGIPYGASKKDKREKMLTSLSLGAFFVAGVLALANQFGFMDLRSASLAILYLVLAYYLIFIVLEFSREHVHSDLVPPE